jgi:hypothetical protein
MDFVFVSSEMGVNLVFQEGQESGSTASRFL